MGKTQITSHVSAISGVISIINPFKSDKSLENIEVNADGSLKYSMQDVINNLESKTELSTKGAFPRSQVSFFPPINQKNLQKNEPINHYSSHQHEFNKLCRSAEYLPNAASTAVSEILRSDVSKVSFRFLYKPITAGGPNPTMPHSLIWPVKQFIFIITSLDSIVFKWILRIY